MAEQEGPRSRAKRRPRLPVVLGIAIAVCTLAFAWVAVPSAYDHAGREAERSASVPKPPPTANESATDIASKRVAITVMTLGNELTPGQIAQFEALNPDTRIVFVEFSTNLLDILLAANDLPDVFRLSTVEYRSLGRRGFLLDITERIANSKVIAPEDMREELAAQATIDGRYHGLPQGLDTPDFASLHINRAAFRQAGIPLPSLQEPMTYAELAAIAKTISLKTGRPAFYSFFLERVVTATLAQRGGKMFSDDLGEMTLTSDPQALDVVRYFYDLAVNGAMAGPPAAPGIAFKFENGELPISQSGYWMGAVVTPAMPAYEQVTMLPAPVWDRSLPRVSSYLGGPVLAISAASQHPDHAYRFIEWYAAGQPAAERARKGWGFPLLRSMEALLPHETAFDRQRLRVALEMLKLPVAPLPQYPHPSILPAFNQSWSKNIAMAQSGKITFSEFASNLQEDVNLAIQDDVNRRNAETSR